MRLGEKEEKNRATLGQAVEQEGEKDRLRQQRERMEGQGQRRGLVCFHAASPCSQKYSLWAPLRLWFPVAIPSPTGEWKLREGGNPT